MIWAVSFTVGFLVGSILAFAVGDILNGPRLFHREVPDHPQKAAMPPTIDWSNPDNAPPAFGPEQPHEYEGSETINCCVKCGGGSLHPVHHGKSFPMAGNDW